MSLTKGLTDLQHPPDDQVAAGALECAPLTPMQAGMWLMNQAFPGRPVFNSSVVIRLRGHLDERAMTAAIAAIVRRHLPLHSVFRLESGALLQRALPATGIALKSIDISGQPAESRTDAARKSAVAFIAQAVNLLTEDLKSVV